jgi:hypothetical protein
MHSTLPTSRHLSSGFLLLLGPPCLAPPSSLQVSFSLVSSPLHSCCPCRPVSTYVSRHPPHLTLQIRSQSAPRAQGAIRHHCRVRAAPLAQPRACFTRRFSLVKPRVYSCAPDTPILLKPSSLASVCFPRRVERALFGAKV